MDDYLEDYLHYVGIVAGVSAHHVRCEVCEEEECQVMVRDVELGPERFGKLPVVACMHCGYLYQNPRFNRPFYDTYYDKHYRRMLFGDTQPDRDFVVDQVRRGEHLFNSLQAHLPKAGRLLDVGCSAGGLMVAFAKRGWRVFGTDPDGAYVRFGQERLGLDLIHVPAEDMALPDAQFDLTIITGSLEHVFDANDVLALCRRACAPNGLLFVEGRALGFGIQKGFFSHNHRRYLTINSLELLMRKHGWSPQISTTAPLCGPTRPGGVYVLGRACEPLGLAELRREITQGRRDLVSETVLRLNGLRGLA